MNAYTFRNNRNKWKKKKIPISKKKTKVRSKSFVKKKKKQNKTKSNIVSLKWLKRCSRLELLNSKLASDLKLLMANRNEDQDTYIKYLTLKKKILETEEKLLMNGINTSEYPAFSIIEEETTETNETSKFQQLLLYEVLTEKNNSDPKFKLSFTPERLISETLNENRNDKSSKP